MPRVLSAAIAATLVTLLAGAAWAGVRIFSYDPANASTQRTAGDLTFEFNQRLLFTRVLSIRSTEGEAAADLKPADERALGGGGLTRLIGPRAQERDLYEVQPGQQGSAMIRAFCPGSTRAWLAFGRLAEGVALRVRVIGDDPNGGRARLCHTLDFNFRGEWKLPGRQGVPFRDLRVPSSGPPV
jgi:hypothetical protein